jgi:hypothetical protein
MTPWRKGAQGSRDRASQALAWTHRTKYVAIQQVVKQSQPVSRMTFDKLSLSLTLLIRISTMTCYASFIIRPVTILLERGYSLRVEIFEHDGGQIAPHHIPTFEETFASREEAIEFGLAEGKKLIDSGELSQPTN